MARRGTQPQWTGTCSSSCGALSSPGAPGTGAGPATSRCGGSPGRDAAGRQRRRRVRRLSAAQRQSAVLHPSQLVGQHHRPGQLRRDGQPGESGCGWSRSAAATRRRRRRSGSGSGPASTPARGRRAVGVRHRDQFLAVPVGAERAGRPRRFPAGPVRPGLPVSVPGSTSNAILGSPAAGCWCWRRRAALARPPCEWFNPLAGSTESLLPAASGQAGVVAAVAYGTG